MKRQFQAAVTQEGPWYVAQCLDVDVASQGEAEAEALANLREALLFQGQDFGHTDVKQA